MTDRTDYADQRYYNSSYGRFWSPDPARSATLGDPGSWNQYAYGLGDPINSVDPDGTNIQNPDYDSQGGGGGAWWFTTFYWSPESGSYLPGATVGGGAPDSGGDPQGGAGSGHTAPYYLTHPCDRNDATNARIFNFMDAHRADAKELADQVNVPWEWILGASAEETTYGTEGIVTKGTNNFFGLHVDDANDTSHYMYQISVYKTVKDGYVAAFADKTGFLDSGMGFLSIEKPYIQGLTNVDSFAQAIHAHGYGTPNADYVSQLTNVVGLLKAREDCAR